MGDEDENALDVDYIIPDKGKGLIILLYGEFDIRCLFFTKPITITAPQESARHQPQRP
jgi:hypothetical protein